MLLGRLLVIGFGQSSRSIPTINISTTLLGWGNYLEWEVCERRNGGFSVPLSFLTNTFGS